MGGSPIDSTETNTNLTKSSQSDSPSVAIAGLDGSGKTMVIDHILQLEDRYRLAKGVLTNPNPYFDQANKAGEHRTFEYTTLLHLEALRFDAKHTITIPSQIIFEAGIKPLAVALAINIPVVDENEILNIYNLFPSEQKIVLKMEAEVFEARMKKRLSMRKEKVSEFDIQMVNNPKLARRVLEIYHELAQTAGFLPVDTSSLSRDETIVQVLKTLRMTE